MRIGGVVVSVVRKRIKNLHLGVYPPNGRVRVAVPMGVSDDAVRLAVVDRLAWIRRQQARFAAQPRQSVREMISGESHYFLGRRYRLRVVEGVGAGAASCQGSMIELRVPRGADAARRERVLHEWYRRQLKALLPALLASWEEKLGVQTRDWGVKKMKTRWGSCNPRARRIWLNLELAKKPVHCLEYVLVHELAHLVERGHGERFLAIMDRHLPQWRVYRQELNSAPLAHEAWDD